MTRIEYRESSCHIIPTVDYVANGLEEGGPKIPTSMYLNVQKYLPTRPVSGKPDGLLFSIGRACCMLFSWPNDSETILKRDDRLPAFEICCLRTRLWTRNPMSSGWSDDRRAIPQSVGGQVRAIYVESGGLTRTSERDIDK